MLNNASDRLVDAGVTEEAVLQLELKPEAPPGAKSTSAGKNKSKKSSFTTGIIHKFKLKSLVMLLISNIVHGICTIS